MLRLVDLYVSWCSGLTSSRKALGLLKKSGIVDGVETSGTGKEFFPIQELGLKASLHNPLRFYRLGLDDSGFVPKLLSEKQIMGCCNASDPETVGFHSGYSAVDNPKSNQSVILRHTIRNLNRLEKIIDKKLIFESCVYNKRFSFNSTNKGLFFVTNPVFMEKVLSETNSGFLFDISHNFVSGMTKKREGLYKGSIEDYFDEMLRVVGEKTFQLHVNVPLFDKQNGFDDYHKPFLRGDKVSDKIIDLTKRVISASPNLKLINLEISTGAEPEKHAQKMIQQAKYFVSKVKLIKS